MSSEFVIALLLKDQAGCAGTKAKVKVKSAVLCQNPFYYLMVLFLCLTERFRCARFILLDKAAALSIMSVQTTLVVDSPLAGENCFRGEQI